MTTNRDGNNVLTRRTGGACVLLLRITFITSYHKRRIFWQSLSTKHRTKSLTHQTGNYPVTCFVSRPSGITLVKFHSLQITIKTNLLAELNHAQSWTCFRSHANKSPAWSRASMELHLITNISSMITSQYRVDFESPLIPDSQESPPWFASHQPTPTLSRSLMPYLMYTRVVTKIPAHGVWNVDRVIDNVLRYG